MLFYFVVGVVSGGVSLVNRLFSMFIVVLFVFMFLVVLVMVIMVLFWLGNSIIYVSQLLFELLCMSMGFWCLVMDGCMFQFRFDLLFGCVVCISVQDVGVSSVFLFWLLVSWLIVNSVRFCRCMCRLLVVVQIGGMLLLVLCGVVVIGLLVWWFSGWLLCVGLKLVFVMFSGLNILCCISVFIFLLVVCLVIIVVIRKLLLLQVNLVFGVCIGVLVNVVLIYVLCCIGSGWVLVKKVFSVVVLVRFFGRLVWCDSSCIRVILWYFGCICVDSFGSIVDNGVFYVSMFCLIRCVIIVMVIGLLVELIIYWLLWVVVVLVLLWCILLIVWLVILLLWIISMFIVGVVVFCMVVVMCVLSVLVVLVLLIVRISFSVSNVCRFCVLLGIMVYCVWIDCMGIFVGVVVKLFLYVFWCVFICLWLWLCVVCLVCSVVVCVVYVDMQMCRGVSLLVVVELVLVLVVFGVSWLMQQVIGGFLDSFLDVCVRLVCCWVGLVWLCVW